MRSYGLLVLVLLAAVAGLTSASRGYCLRMQMEAQAQARQQYNIMMMAQRQQYNMMMRAQRQFYSGGGSPTPARREAAASRSQSSKRAKRLKNLESQYNRAQEFGTASREAKAQSLYNQAVAYEKSRLDEPARDYYDYASRLSPDGQIGISARAALSRLGENKTLINANRAQMRSDPFQESSSPSERY